MMPGLQIFKNRTQKDYIDLLGSILSLDGTNHGGLLATSGPADETNKQKWARTGHDIDKILRIDLIGMTGSVLLAKSAYNHESQLTRLRDIFESIDILNKKHKTAIRIRFILQYPYSQAGQNRVLAESWAKRSMIGDDITSARDETSFAMGLNEDMIETSQLMQVQRECIANFRELTESVSDHLKKDSPNRVEMRFACISILLCGLRVNDTFLFDPYHYGRRPRERVCALDLTPVSVVNRRLPEGEGAFSAFCNHFRYIWECDSTLAFEDVIRWEEEACDVTLLKPLQIRGQAKVQRLRERAALSKSKREPDYWERYPRHLSRIVERICPIVGKIDQPEVGFIAATWTKRTLCEPAKLLFKHFTEDFPTSDKVRVTFLRAELGQSITKELFRHMDASTFGLIVLTKQSLARPNVFFELGYLMRRNGPDRTFIISEEGAEAGSDLSDFIKHEFSYEHGSPAWKEILEKEMREAYVKVLNAMAAAGVISRSTLEYVLSQKAIG